MIDEPTASSELDGMTKAELLSYAAENGISGVSSGMTKAEIYKAIKGAS